LKRKYPSASEKIPSQPRSNSRFSSAAGESTQISSPTFASLRLRKENAHPGSNDTMVAAQLMTCAIRADQKWAGSDLKARGI
jgi:hypothetical protein